MATYILAFFTDGGAPVTGLSPTIRIRRVDTGALVVTDAAMVEVGDGFYRYNFTLFVSNLDYAIRCDGGVSLSDSDRYKYSGTDDLGLIYNIESFVENLPVDPTSETNATANKNAIISEINANETKIDSIKAKTDLLTFSGTNVQARVNDKGVLNDPTKEAIADQVWDELLAGHTSVGSMGELQGLIDDIKAKTDNLPVDPASESNATSNKNQIIGEINDNEFKIDDIKAKTDLLSFDGANVNAKIADAGVLNDPTVGEIADAVWDEPLAGHVIAGTTGENQGLIDDIDDQTSQLNFSGANVQARVADKGILNDPSANDIIDGTWNELLADHVTVGSMGANQNLIDDIKAKTDNLPSDPASETNATANKVEIIGEIDDNEAKIDLIKIQTDRINFDVSDNIQVRVNDKGILNDPTAEAIADQVWDEQISGHLTSGSTGEALSEDPFVIDYSVQRPSVISGFAFKDQELNVSIKIWEKTGAVQLGVSNITNPGNYAVYRFRGGAPTVIDSGQGTVSISNYRVRIDFSFILTSSDFIPGDTIFWLIAGIDVTVGSKLIRIPDLYALTSLTGENVSASAQIQAGSTTQVLQTDLEATIDDFFASNQILIEKNNGALPDNWLARNVKAYNATTKEVTLDDPLPFAPAEGDRIVILARKSSWGNAEDYRRLFGLNHENIWTTNNYDVNGVHVGSIVEIYDSKANAESHDGSTGLIAKYTLTVGVTGARADNLLMTRDS